MSRIRDSWEEIKSIKICAIDLDDTLGYSIEKWLEYVNDKTGRCFNDLRSLKDTLSYNEYRKHKYGYRTSGIKAGIKPLPKAKELTHKLRSIGYKICIITARPEHKIPGLGRLTYNWLDNNGIQYDSVLFSKSKHVDIMLRFPDLHFYINDHRTEANLISRWGYPCFLINNKYNQGIIKERVIRIDELMDIFKYKDIVRSENE